MWNCAICGKQNNDDGTLQRLCVVCGREKGYAGSKQIQALNQSRLDPTPHLTNAKSEEKKQARQVQKKRSCWKGPEAKQSMFLSSASDYQIAERVEIREEVSSVIESVRASLEDN